MLHAIIAVLFLIMLASLMAGAGFLLRDNGQSKRLLTSLKWRIGCAVLLVITLIYGFSSGQL
ncbi:hypothetical protein GCM10011297_05510 [Bacterioplanes sanyensis]|uniref:DUF2909 domain-containing protein n=1 Tax=Bacterioplanes sanyensis TaxID=1249553 RepID=UPI0019B3D3B6|nr:DUF2909 domain-containing protein [Bacterioplanes sanyensis]GGY35311.1 hypothetical protein GCM10011297_05510 [Bacterioplanes sanyensis]